MNKLIENLAFGLTYRKEIYNLGNRAWCLTPIHYEVLFG